MAMVHLSFGYNTVRVSLNSDRARMATHDGKAKLFGDSLLSGAPEPRRA